MGTVSLLQIAPLCVFLLPAVVLSKQTVSHGLPYHAALKPYHSSLAPYHPTHPQHQHHPSPLPYLPAKASPVPPYHPSTSNLDQPTQVHLPLPNPPSHYPPSYPPHHSPPIDYKSVPTNYDFVYSVHDSYSGDDHSHQEKKTNHLTQGQYTVKLPDGRTQVVSYTADDDGYHPVVEYQGVAHYDHPHHHHHPAPAIHLDPVTKEELAVTQYKIPPKAQHVYKYSPTPYPAGPKVFRPKSPKPVHLLSKGPEPKYLPTPLPKVYNRPSPLLYNLINHAPLHYKGKLVFLDKPKSDAQVPPPLPPHSPAP